MEDMKKEHPEGCKCEMCENGSCKGMMCKGMWHRGCCGGKHHILRWILGLAILAVVFCGGFKLGVIVGSINGGFGYSNHGGYRMMLRGGDYNAYGPWMMGGRYYQTSTSSGK
ncbi:MAG: hypothetical protein ABSE68_01775 [Minisyncoccia bacterium]